LIEPLQKQGKSVCFIGDGINDAIALKKADVSISLHGASTIATDTAQVILMDDSLNQLIKLFDLAESLEKNFRNSMLWDVVPNVMCIGGAFFFHLGIYGALAIYIVCQINILVGVQASESKL
jgi:Cu2+-exporting ATPase